MRATFLLFAVLVITFVNAATITARSTLSTTPSLRLVNSIDTAHDGTSYENKRLLRSDRELQGKDIDNDEERKFLPDLGKSLSKLFGGKTTNKVTAEQLNAASKKLKVNPEQVQAVSRKRKFAAEQVTTASNKRRKVTPNKPKVTIPEHLKITNEQLMGLREGRTRDVFLKWGKHKTLPDDIKPMLNGLSRNDQEKVLEWYTLDMYRRGKWNIN
ncbi:RxLR effector protein [Phytophthora megakarya]|uniref:RxLR effector protein n=1 Tax=Phytophthora megakarya TaxID=4795 RepID=A0A225WKB3_9STRA|nr:RxLR effector protein [Phytophthora megakarya]